MSTEVGKKSDAVVKKKGTKESELVIGSAANAIKKSLDDLKKAVDTVSELGTQAENYQALIVQREERIKEIDQEYSEKRRAANVAFDLDMKADQEKAIEEVLSKGSKVAIDDSELTDLRTKAQKNEEEMKREISSAVHAATGSMKKDHDNAMALRAAEVKAEQAENAAKINALTAQVSYLEKENKSWQDALAAERTASVERSKANAIGSINVGGPSKS